MKAKSLAKAVALTLATLAAAPAFAASVTDQFDVIVNLTGACRISSAPGDITINHTAYSAASTATTNFAVQCSQGLRYNVTMPVVADNILANLGLTNSVAISAGGSTNVLGTNAGNTHTITASVGAVNEGGTCTVANPGVCSATNTYTLTIAY